MIDSSVQNLLEKAIDSSIKLQLVLMFYENPRMEGSAGQIAQRIFRDIWSTNDALQELTADGILASIGEPRDPVFRYRPLPEYIEPIFRLNQSFNEPMERDRVQLVLRQVAGDALFRRSTQGAYEYQMI